MSADRDELLASVTTPTGFAVCRAFELAYRLRSGESVGTAIVGSMIASLGVVDAEQIDALQTDPAVSVRRVDS